MYKILGYNKWKIQMKYGTKSKKKKKRRGKKRTEKKNYMKQLEK